MTTTATRGKTTGRAIPMPGNDIDTDRIIPARYLKNVTFDGLGEAAFIDERAADRKAGRTHPFDDPRYEGGSIMVVGRNFGCGSSREHAPQALQRFGSWSFGPFTGCPGGIMRVFCAPRVYRVGNPRFEW